MSIKTSACDETVNSCLASQTHTHTHTNSHIHAESGHGSGLILVAVLIHCRSYRLCALIYSSFWPNNIVRRFVIEPLVSTISALNHENILYYSLSPRVIVAVVVVFFISWIHSSLSSSFFFLIQTIKSGHRWLLCRTELSIPKWFRSGLPWSTKKYYAFIAAYQIMICWCCRLHWIKRSQFCSVCLS